MEEQYLQDLGNATEVILDDRKNVRAPGEPRHIVPITTSGGGSSGRAAAGAVRIGNAVGAAFTNRRVLPPIEARLLLITGLLFAGLTVLLYFFPRLAACPLMVALAWIAIALIYRSYKLYRNKANREATLHPS